MENYPCLFDGCIRSFSDPSSRRKHAAIHTGPKPYRCTHCMMAFPDSISTSLHIKTYHDFSTEQHMPHRGNELQVKKHPVNKSDIGKDEFWCPFCSVAFGSISEVDVHISQSHTEMSQESKATSKTNSKIERVKCNQRSSQSPVLRCTYQGCNRLFAWPHHLQYHIKTHEGVRLHTCDFVGCEKAFLTAQQKNVHMKSHTGEKNFVCSIENCQKKFTTAQHLKNHMRIHTGEKPFKCTHLDCDKSFREYSSLKKHLVVHTGEKPYKCSQCDRAFTQNSTLHTHIKRRHSEKTETKESTTPSKGDKLKVKPAKRSRKKVTQTKEDVKAEGITPTQQVQPAKDNLQLLLVHLISEDSGSKKLDSASSKSPSSLMPGKDVLLVPTRKEMTSPISQLSAIDTSSTSQKNVIVVSQPSDNTVVPSFYEQHYMDIESECDVQTQDSDFHFYTEVTDHPMESDIKQGNIVLEGT